MKRFLKVLALVSVMTICLFYAVGAAALVRSTCGLDDCICFIQYGDKGMAVRRTIKELYAQGYLASGQGSTYTAEVVEAVRQFQKDHRITQDGKLTDNTLTWLLWGMGVTKLDKAYPQSDGQEVWVSTDGGTKFHSDPTCSGMSYARKLSARNAQEIGFTPCKKCWSY